MRVLMMDSFQNPSGAGFGGFEKRLVRLSGSACTQPTHDVLQEFGLLERVVQGMVGVPTCG
jgi:hypothetical protein